VPETLTNPVLLGSLLVPGGFPSRGDDTERARPAGPRLGELPIARRDVERLSQILQLQRRLRDMGANPRVQNALTHRNVFREALTWLEVHGNSEPLVAHWNTVTEQRGTQPAEADGQGDRPLRRRRRRRRRRYRPAPS
jgi:hypothetical protein